MSSGLSQLTLQGLKNSGIGNSGYFPQLGETQNPHQADDNNGVTLYDDIMGFLTWMIVGLMSGLSVNVLMKRPDRGVLADLLLGALGAVAGGLIASGIFRIPDSIDGLNLVAILVSCAGAVVLVAFVEALSSRRVAA